MRRVVSLLLPTWPTDRLRRRPGAPPAERPLVVAARKGARRCIVAADGAAQAAGLHAGMTVAHAQAMVPGLAVAEADPDSDTAALERLARWCLRYAPIAAADPPDGVVIDITGCAPLFGGEAALLADLAARLSGAGFTTRAAIADTWAASWALARFGAPAAIAPPGGTAAALAALPVAALRLAPAAAASLARLGFERIGDLAAVPRAALALRFSAELLARLDRAEGRLAEPIRPVTETQAPAARQASPSRSAQTASPRSSGSWPESSAGSWRWPAAARGASISSPSVSTRRWRRCAPVWRRHPAIRSTSPGCSKSASAASIPASASRRPNW